MLGNKGNVVVGLVILMLTNCSFSKRVLGPPIGGQGATTGGRCVFVNHGFECVLHFFVASG